MELKIKQRIIGGVALVVVVLVIIAFLSQKGRSPSESGLAAGIPAPQPIKVNIPQTTNNSPNAVTQAIAAAQAPANTVIPVQKNSTQATNTNNVVDDNADTSLFKPVTTSSTPAPTTSPASANTPLMPNKSAVTTTKANTSIAKEITVKKEVQAKAPNQVTLTKATTVKKNIHQSNTVAHTKHAVSHKKLATATLPNAWSVKLGVFAKKSNADKLVKDLRTKGYRAYMQKEKISQQVVYRVFVGPELKKEKATAILTKIQKSFHLNGQIVKYKV